MTQKNDLPILIASLAITAAILGGIYWLLVGNRPNINPSVSETPTETTVPEALPSPLSPQTVSNFPFPTEVTSGTTISINGSTSMVLVNQALKKAFTQRFPNTFVNTNAEGSDKGILDLLMANIDLAAISRPLNAKEQSQGLVAIPMTQDAIAIVVGINNPFRQGLKTQQVRDIFQGKIQNWSELGGKNEPIQVINRPAISGTYQTFQEMVLQGEAFTTGSHVTQMERDATTPILQALKTNGISYATYVQVAQQQTVRVVPIDGMTPESGNYPFNRTLYYVYQDPPSQGVIAFLGYATSPEGKQAIADVHP